MYIYILYCQIEHLSRLAPPGHQYINGAAYANYAYVTHMFAAALVQHLYVMKLAVVVVARLVSIAMHVKHSQNIA
jgi:hypothetical protein